MGSIPSADVDGNAQRRVGQFPEPVLVTLVLLKGDPGAFGGGSLRKAEAGTAIAKVIAVRETPVTR